MKPKLNFFLSCSPEHIINTITNTDFEEEVIECGDCDYTISQGHFDSGKGRIIFNDINEEGTEYRCGCCDDRVSDPMGMFPDTDDEEEEQIISHYDKKCEDC